MLKPEDRIYFINCFRNYIHNTNKEFSRKHTPSLRELLNDYLELHNDILNTSENEKLQKAYKAQLIVMKHLIKKSIYLKSSIGNDLTIFLNKIEDCNIIDKDTNNKSNSHTKEWLLHNVYNYCTAMQKKISNINLYKEIIAILEYSTTYAEFDLCVETLVNELIYDEYSLTYLKEWYKSTTPLFKKEGNMDYMEFINEFAKFKKEKHDFDVYLTMKNDDKSEISNWSIGYSLKMEFIDRSSLSTEIMKHLQLSNTDRAIKISIKSMDGYSATFKVVEAINAYLLIVNLIKNNKYSINEKLSVLDKTTSKLTNFNAQSADFKFLQSSIDKREKYDLEDFIKYREHIYNKNIISGEIISIERSLNILKDTAFYNQQNRLIELWSVLESLLSYYSGKSIISKAEDIIPKIMCLYMLKDKLNILWSLLINSKNREEEAEKFFAESLLTGSTEKYDTYKLVLNIKTQGKDLIDKFGYNSIILNRRYCEIGSILSKEVDLENIIKNTHQIIKYDISRIYRTRNITVHSGNQTKTNILMKNIRLTQYISNLIGVILHYKMKNNDLTIQEILYSIPATYDNYIEMINKFKKANDFEVKLVEEIFKPHYLFL